MYRMLHMISRMLHMIKKNRVDTGDELFANVGDKYYSHSVVESK